MKDLSVVIPVFNSLNTFKNTLIDLVDNTPTLRELVIVDDCSQEETRTFIDNLRTSGKLNLILTKTRNPKHSWTNASWNLGVSLTHMEYIAVINSDVTVPPGWDEDLMNVLYSSTIACPYEKKHDGSTFDLDPVIKMVHPGMIKGACFMFKQDDVKNLFPIPEEIKHWCGDNWLADKAEQLHGVSFDPGVLITHATSSSGRLIDPTVYNKVCKNDLEQYQRLSGRDMSVILDHFN